MSRPLTRASLRPATAALATLAAVLGCSSPSGTSPSMDASDGDGITASGGVSGSGGTTASGGASGSGGTTASGGRPGSGGARPAGGASGSGGTTASGGASGSGGTPGSAGAGGCTPDYACKPTAPSTGDYYADCVARVNQFRACVCLPPLARWTEGESCADMDAAYDPSHSAHAGFVAGICSPEGNAQDECPGYSSETQVVSLCIQQMFDEGPPPTADCTGDCYQMHGHYINMTNTRYTKIACGIATVSGKVTAVQDLQ